MPEPVLHFGGPDRPPRALRDLLQARVEAVPPGGEIVWSTYYFRDRALAQALIDADRRGVRLCLHVEGHPRRRDVNRAVIAMLKRAAPEAIHVHTPPVAALAKLHPHLHSKIYVFSHPVPTAFVGSFNPSGDQPEDADVIAEIGDQDRGHNMLVEFTDAALVGTLARHVRGLGRPLLRLRPDQNRMATAGDTRLWFYPRLRTGIIDSHLAALPAGARVDGAISHMKSGFLADGLIAAARRGVRVRLIVHDTERRVPGATIDALAEAGVEIGRYRHPDHLPLHAKFLLIDAPEGRTSYFGSFNYNPRSRYLNREILLASADRAINDGLAARFAQIRAEGLSA
jgi:phosphatidylserine/phosphatidylglycerophosphate/cardiolipin synthase-like enzyme